MKKHLNNFPEHSISIESYNDLLNPCYDSILRFGDRVLVAKTNWKGGVEAAVYGFAEDPKEGLSSIECRLELLHPERTLRYGRGLPAGGFCS